MIDRTTKAILMAIALGLFLNVAEGWMKPAPVSAQGLSDPSYTTAQALSAIAAGYCQNKRIC